MTQACPNCGKAHDTSIFVTGQKVTCSCGIRFEVQRTDVVSGSGRSSVNVNVAFDESSLGPTISPSRRAEAAPTNDGTHVVSAAPPEIPGYRLLEVLGRGGMGEVWRATQESLGRAVAIKLLPPKFSRDADFVARFEKEATALASLSHPNVVQIIDRGSAGDHVYFVMEFVPGKSLRDLIRGAELKPNEALKLGLQLCRAVDYAHSRNIIHRDLKPENILVDEQGHVKVADFGLAGMQGAKEYNLTATSVAMGTVNYMAPEQRRDAKNVDHRADLYSLGVVLYELLTGELPIGRFKMPSQRVKGLDPRVDEIIGKALESDVEGRPNRAAEVAEVLDAVLANSSASLLDPSRRATNPDSPRSRPVGGDMGAGRTGRDLAVGAMVLVGLGLIGVMLKFMPAATGTSPTVAREPPATYADTEDDLASTAVGDDRNLTIDFEPGDGAQFNAHSGSWSIDDGALIATQFGQATVAEHPKLVPRAYLSSHYYSADDFSAQVDMQVEDLPAQFPPVPQESQRFGELAFRIKDLQVSIFAIPDVGVRLGWRYFTPDGTEVVGNSSRDLEQMVEDEVLAPVGRFRLKLSLKKSKGGAVDAEAFINGQRFVHKMLPGLAGQVGKVALGCRNSQCRFDDLKISGQVARRPESKAAAE